MRWARRLQDLTSWVLRDEGSPEARLRQYRPSQDPVEIAVFERSQSGISTAEQFAWTSTSEAFRSWRGHLKTGNPGSCSSQWARTTSADSGRGDDYAPSVAVNTAYHPTAWIFTLFHEVAHLLTRTDAACQSFVFPVSKMGLSKGGASDSRQRFSFLRTV